MTTRWGAAATAGMLVAGVGVLALPRPAGAAAPIAVEISTRVVVDGAAAPQAAPWRLSVVASGTQSDLTTAASGLVTTSVTSEDDGSTALRIDVLDGGLLHADPVVDCTVDGAAIPAAVSRPSLGTAQVALDVAGSSVRCDVVLRPAIAALSLARSVVDASGATVPGADLAAAVDVIRTDGPSWYVRDGVVQTGPVALGAAGTAEVGVPTGPAEWDGTPYEIGRTAPTGTARVAVACTTDGSTPVATPTRSSGAAFTGFWANTSHPAACLLVDMADVARMGVVTRVGTTPAATTLRATIVSPTGARFPDGATTATLASPASAVPALLELAAGADTGAGVRLRIESAQPGWTVASADCEANGATHPATLTGGVLDITVRRTAASVPGATWGTGEPYPVCWLGLAEVTVSTLELVATVGGVPTAGHDLAVVPASGTLLVDGVPDADGIVPSSTTARRIDLSGVATGSRVPVFVGQRTVPGATVLDVTCDGSVRPAPEVRTIAGGQFAGATVEVTVGSPLRCQVVSGRADLVATKTASTAEVGPGTIFSYEIVVSNAGTAPVLGVSLDDDVPSQLTLLGARVAEASTVCTTAGNAVSCEIGRLEAGARRVVTLDVVVSAVVVTPGSITNVVLTSGEVPLWDTTVFGTLRSAQQIELGRQPVNASARSIVQNRGQSSGSAASSGTPGAGSVATSGATSSGGPVASVPVVNAAVLPETGTSPWPGVAAGAVTLLGAALLVVARRRRLSTTGR